MSNFIYSTTKFIGNSSAYYRCFFKKDFSRKSGSISSTVYDDKSTIKWRSYVSFQKYFFLNNFNTLLAVFQARSALNAKKRLVNNVGQNLSEITLNHQDFVKKFRPIVPRQTQTNSIRNNLISGKKFLV